MNRKKSSPESLWNHHDMETLRSERPSETAIDRTVDAVLAFSPAPPKFARPAHVWRAATLVSGLGVGALLLFVAVQPASAASLSEIADAFRHQSTRHSKTYRPGASGALTLTNEDWIDGPRHAGTYVAPDGERTSIGYDGRRMFRVSSKGEGFIDDVAPSKPPVEDLDAYLGIPGARLEKQRQEGRWDVYTIAYPAIRCELYVDPATRLPARRDVLSLRGGLIERNEYDYPTRLSDTLFQPPARLGLVDYPALRRRLAAKLGGPGQTKRVGGVEVSLKAVIVGESRVLALWTGGAQGEASSKDGLRIVGMAKPILNARPEALPILPGGQPLRGDGAWYPKLRLDGPFGIDLPVGTEGRSKPAGRVVFRVDDAIEAPDPDRVLARPDGGASDIAEAKTR